MANQILDQVRMLVCFAYIVAAAGYSVCIISSCMLLSLAMIVTVQNCPCIVAMTSGSCLSGFF